MSVRYIAAAVSAAVSTRCDGGNPGDESKDLVAATQDLTYQAAERELPPRPCVLFHEMHKVASATTINIWGKGIRPAATFPRKTCVDGVRYGATGPRRGEEGTLQLPAGKRFPSLFYSHWCDTYTWEQADETCARSERSTDAPHTLATSAGALVHGAFTPALASRNPELFGRERCSSVAIVREPLRRLVSAFIYCRTARIDPLCANWMVRPTYEVGYEVGAPPLRPGEQRVPLLKPHSLGLDEFAEHWGNYLLRELMLADWPRRDQPCGVACAARKASPAATEHALRSPQPIVWYLQKLALNGTDDPRTAAGREAVRRVVRRLRGTGAGSYDALGVMERWNDSMRLFDSAVPLVHATWGRRSWGDETARHRVHGAKKGADGERRERELLHEARCSRRVRAALAADLFLYHRVIVPLFERQLAAAVRRPSRSDAEC